VGQEVKRKWPDKRSWGPDHARDITGLGLGSGGPLNRAECGRGHAVRDNLTCNQLRKGGRAPRPGTAHLSSERLKHHQEHDAALTYRGAAEVMCSRLLLKALSRRARSILGARFALPHSCAVIRFAQCRPPTVMNFVIGLGNQGCLGGQIDPVCDVGRP
jgi:hypothetical protein